MPNWIKSLIKMEVSGALGWHHLSVKNNTWNLRELPTLKLWCTGESPEQIIELPVGAVVRQQIPLAEACKRARYPDPGIAEASKKKWPDILAVLDGLQPPQDSPLGNVKGSKYWVRYFVNNAASALNEQIICHSPSLTAFDPESVCWRSPILADGFKEYRNGFLLPLGMGHHEHELCRFWSRSGPSWDALASVKSKSESRQGVVLVEGKAHPNEANSVDRATDNDGIASHAAAFDEVKRYMGVRIDADWTNQNYQLANRLAFLYFLHVRLATPTWLVMLNFVEDWTNRPTPMRDWRTHQQEKFHQLGIDDKCKLLDRIITVHIECPRQERI